MPRRPEPFINGDIYHVFNRTIEKKKIFLNDANCRLFLDTLIYYRSFKAHISFSKLKILDRPFFESLMKKVRDRKYFRADILAYCLMPTHFHFLLKQISKNGIPNFISDLINSFTRYLNIKNERAGPLFLPKFKSVRIGTDEQLMHVSRYIHLNPYSNGLITNAKDLITYPWSSLKGYQYSRAGISNPKPIMLLFKNNFQRYERFILSHKEHQKTLEFSKHSKKW